jgi:hypothetical protein
MSDDAKPEDEMQAIEQLLPWYAAGTLDGASVKRVEAALAREPKLRESLRLAREDRDETLTLNERLGAPGPQAWARVLAVAQAEPRRPTLWSRLVAIAAFPSSRTNPAPGRWAWAAAAALVLIVLQGGAIVSLLSTKTHPAYETASQSPAVAEGAAVLVAFAPDANLRQVAELLQKYRASIVDGPRGGMFRLRVGDKTMPKDQFDAIVIALRAEPLVRSALPSWGQ